MPVKLSLSQVRTWWKEVSEVALISASDHWVAATVLVADDALPRTPVGEIMASTSSEGTHAAASTRGAHASSTAGTNLGANVGVVPLGRVLRHCGDVSM